MIKKEMSWPICRDIPYNRHLSMAMGDYHDLPSPILPDPPLPPHERFPFKLDYHRIEAYHLIAKSLP